MDIDLENFITKAMMDGMMVVLILRVLRNL